MKILQFLLAGWVLVLGGGQALAQGPLELFPEAAAASLAIRDLDGLIKKGDKFLTETKVQLPLRPSALFDQALGFLGVRQGLDRSGSAAILLMRPTNENDRLGLDSINDLLVPVIPFKDADQMAENFGAGKGLKIKEVARTGQNDFKRFASRTKEHFYLSGSEATLKRIHASKRVADTLSADQRVRLNQSDILVQLGRYLWEKEFESFYKELANKIKPSDDPQEVAFAEQFADSLRELQNVLVGFRLEDGIDTHVLATVPKDGKAAKILASLRDKRPSSSLQGLPEGNLLFAQASSGDSAKQAMLARALFGFMLEDLLVSQKIIAHVDRLTYLGIFHEVWRQLQGNRIAVYQNLDEKKLGLFSAIAILDTDNAPQFLREMKTLAKMATAESLDLTRPEIKQEIDIERLVRDLGSSVFGIRNSANTKLALIGEPSLPYLQKAIDSKKLDLETLRRSQQLRTRISAVAAERRKELLSETNQPLFLRPKLTFVSNVEKRQGLSIDAVNIKIAGLEKVGTHQYTQLLGPDWDKVRLAVVGNQVVVMLGSDLELFDAAVRNVKMKEPGLANSKLLAGFHARAAKERAFELHVSVEGILRLISPKAPRDTPLAMTSVALTLGAQSLAVDARVPTPEVRAIARKAQEGMQ